MICYLIILTLNYRRKYKEELAPKSTISYIKGAILIKFKYLAYHKYKMQQILLAPKIVKLIKSQENWNIHFYS